MAVVWTIAGEIGKALDATPRTLPELQAEGAEVNFTSLESDTLSWDVWMSSVTDPVLLPELGQQLTLFRNGARYFTGTVTGRKPQTSADRYGYGITVEGPLWWLKQIALSSDIPDQSNTASERTAYVFPTGSPRTHLIALIYRAIALGAPISEGPIASCFNVSRSSLRNMPFSEAFAEIMRWIADGIVYVDYSVSGFPAICMQRRTPATTITLNPENITISNIDLSPRLDLQVEELKVFYARRATVDNKRLMVWDSQTAGALTTGLPRRQPALISGPEIDTYLPQDFTDSVVVRSSLLKAFGEVKGDVFEYYDERIRAAGATNLEVGAYVDPDRVGGPFTLKSIATKITDADGNDVSPAYLYYLTTGAIRDWWTKDGIEHVQSRIAATIREVQTYDVGSPDPIPDWAEVIGAQTIAYNISTPTGLRTRRIYYATISVSVPLVKTLWSTPTTLIRAEDYAFVNPPAGLAANLLATQNWLPYEGNVGPVAVGEIPAGNPVGSVLNISGFLPETANMRALISGCSVRLATSLVTYTVGAPPRMAFRDLVNRFRQSGADNIVFLVDSVSGDPGENPPPDPDLEIPEYPAGTITFTSLAITMDGETLEFTP